MERNPLLDWALGLKSVGAVRRGAGGYSGSVDSVQLGDGLQYPHQGTVRQDPSLISSRVQVGTGWVNRRLSKRMQNFLGAPEKRLPLRSKVSEAYIVPNGELKSLIKKTLRVIDKVHSDGELPEIHIQKSVAQWYHGQFQQWWPDNGGKPRALRILLSRYGPHKEFTLCHEVGHHIDWQGWTGNKAESDTLTNPLFKDWFDETMKSTPVLELQKAVNSGKIAVVPTGSGGPTQAATRVGYAKYLLRHRELWARCYAQYIATKSRNPILRRQLRAQRVKVPGKPYYYRQWSDAEFRPIMAAMDAIFQDKGWL